MLCLWPFGFIREVYITPCLLGGSQPTPLISPALLFFRPQHRPHQIWRRLDRTPPPPLPFACSRSHAAPPARSRARAPSLRHPIPSTLTATQLSLSLHVRVVRSALESLGANTSDLASRRVGGMKQAPRELQEEYRQAKTEFSEHKLKLKALRRGARIAS